MHEIDSYGLSVYGNQDGFQDTRTQISLNNGGTQVGFINFHDHGMNFPADSVDQFNRISMHLPSLMLHNILDILRNESPLYIDIQGSNAVLFTSLEPAGERD